MARVPPRRGGSRCHGALHRARRPARVPPRVTEPGRGRIRRPGPGLVRPRAHPAAVDARSVLPALPLGLSRRPRRLQVPAGLAGADRDIARVAAVSTAAAAAPRRRRSRRDVRIRARAVAEPAHRHDRRRHRGVVAVRLAAGGNAPRLSTLVRARDRRRDRAVARVANRARDACRCRRSVARRGRVPSSLRRPDRGRARVGVRRCVERPRSGPRACGGLHRLGCRAVARAPRVVQRGRHGRTVAPPVRSERTDRPVRLRQPRDLRRAGSHRRRAHRLHAGRGGSGHMGVIAGIPEVHAGGSARARARRLCRRPQVARPPPVAPRCDDRNGDRRLLLLVGRRQRDPVRPVRRARPLLPLHPAGAARRARRLGSDDVAPHGRRSPVGSSCSPWPGRYRSRRTF